MNKRLERILSHIPDGGAGTVDVGTDHGYLPAALALRGYSGRIFASDIREGPLRSARRTAEEAGAAEKIRCLLCDGLADCPRDQIDTIVIAGMGGDTICGILDRAEWCMDGRYTLLLQPVTKAEVLRYWLVNNGFAVFLEDPVEDGGILYPLIAARFGGETRLSEAELFTGSAALLRGNPLLKKLLARQRLRFERALAGLRAAAPAADDGRAAVFETILKQLKEMEA